MAAAEGWRVSACGEYFVADILSSDFEAEIKVARPFKLDNQRSYKMQYLKWPAAEGLVVNVRDSIRDERVGVICSIESLSTRDHSWSSDEHFDLVASALPLKLLLDLANFSIPVAWRDGGSYELSDFFPEHLAVLAIRDPDPSGRSPQDYLPSLLKRGFLSYSGHGRYCDDEWRLPALGKEVKVKPMDSRFGESEYVRHLFERLLPRETSPLAYFVAAYQVLELLMQDVFQERLTEFKREVAAFDGCASDLRKLNQKLAEVTGEEARLRVVFEGRQVARSSFPDLANACEELIGATATPALQLHELVYQVRNKILHSLRDLPKKQRERIVTDRPIGATRDRRNGATCRPRKTGLERGSVCGVFRGLGNRRFRSVWHRSRGAVAGAVEDHAVGAVA